jgi:hypothetical protein
MCQSAVASCAADQTTGPGCTNISRRSEPHRQTPHLQKWRETVKDGFDGELQLQVCSTVFPTEQNWKAVKPALEPNTPISH